MTNCVTCPKEVTCAPSALDTALLLAGGICEGQATKSSAVPQCVLVQPVQLRVLVSVGLRAGRTKR